MLFPARKTASDVSYGSHATLVISLVLSVAIQDEVVGLTIYVYIYIYSVKNIDIYIRWGSLHLRILLRIRLCHGESFSFESCGSTAFRLS